MPGIDDDDHAAKYELADELISAAGLRLVRGQQLVPHPGRRPAGTTSPTGAATTGGASARARTRTSGGVRWWNVKHPTAYANRLGAGASPAAGRETLDSETRNVERVMLEARLNSGLDIPSLGAWGTPGGTPWRG